jgi:glycosyltransferase A (GT-A) superfamily protein (DUF2064 family)
MGARCYGRTTLTQGQSAFVAVTDVLLDAALQAATGLQQLLALRHDCTTVTTPAEQAAATGLTSAAAELGKAAEAPPPGAIRDLRDPDAAGEDND